MYRENMRLLIQNRLILNELKSQIIDYKEFNMHPNWGTWNRQV